MSLHEIINVREILPGLLTGGQPTEPELESVATAGYQRVVNLGLQDAAYSLVDEAGICARLGMAYHHIPVDFEHPRLEDLQSFTDLAAEHAGERLFVHCAMNYRASAFVALLLEHHHAWPRPDADALIHEVWEPYGSWPEFIAKVRAQWAVR